MLKNGSTVSYLYSFSQQRGRRKLTKVRNKEDKRAFVAKKSLFSTSFDALYFYKKINYLQSQAGNHFLLQQEWFLKSIGAPRLAISSWDIRKGLLHKNNLFCQLEENEGWAEKNWSAVCQYLSAKNPDYFCLLRKVSILVPSEIFGCRVNYVRLRKALDLLVEYYRKNLL